MPKPTVKSQIQPKTSDIHIALLTGGDDKSYALGLTSALVARGIRVDFIGSNAVDGPELHTTSLINFLNLRGDQREDASLWRKVLRISVYYARLLMYTVTARPRLFHILWNNKFEWFDRTLLMLYYQLWGKRIAFTAHNVNAAKRDGSDTWFNRLTLRIQYRLCHQIFVHTERMRSELVADFGVPAAKVAVIPFGINATFSDTSMTSGEAKERLGLWPDEKAVLFFGQIAPYKGLEHLVEAFAQLGRNADAYRLVIAGKVKKGHADYWDQVWRQIANSGIRERLIQRTEFIPEAEVELYFKAADVLVIPYVHIFQSGVPFLAYNYGLPVIVSDVGSLKEDVVEGTTGFVCRPHDPEDLARTIETYFASDLYHELETRRRKIREFTEERYSWTNVGRGTQEAYDILLLRA